MHPVKIIPVPLAWSETRTALQIGTVDGGDLPIDVIHSQKVHGVAKHIALTGHFALSPPFFVSDKLMSKLTDEERAAVYTGADLAAEASRAQERGCECTALIETINGAAS